jgi:hypothetical protein
VQRKYIPIYIQQDATLHSLFYLETALHVSGGTSTHHQGRKQLYLQHLVFVTPLLLPAAIVEELERCDKYQIILIRTYIIYNLFFLGKYGACKLQRMNVREKKRGKKKNNRNM